MPIATYHHVLQSSLSLADTRWDFTIPNLPPAADCDRVGYMKSCCLYAGAGKQGISLSFSKIGMNRAISNTKLSSFVHLTCSDFRLHAEDGTPMTFNESSDYIARFLKGGLRVNGELFSFYGHSNSQLKSRSCFLMLGNPDEVEKHIEAMGDFSKMKTVAKKAKRIGLLFSTAQAILNIDPARCRDINDIERDEHIFTDGCGNISPSLVNLIAQKKPLLFRNKRYHPSVLQIRYRGYKGVVAVDPRLPSAVWLEFRKSMQKFSGVSDHSFAVVGHSQPYTYGYLNDELILLLHSLGISEDVLHQKQKEYFCFLDSAANEPATAFRFLSSINEISLAQKALLEGIETTVQQIQRLVAQEYSKMINKRSLRRCRILIPKSRLLFGICDQRGVLREGECFVKPTSDSDGVSHAISGCYVLVSRNPCLHPGDLQKLRAVARDDLDHLTDCIVFSTKGRRPAADMMSGGDLDGDTFFVTWDPDLIPSNIAQPAEYPGPKEPFKMSSISRTDRIQYFAHSSNMQLGAIKNLYMKWARLKGPLSGECQELNRLFSQCVDGNRLSIPDRLKDPPGIQNKSKFILDDLQDSANQHVRSVTRTNLLETAPSLDTLLAILNEPTAMSQFELARLSLEWCQTHGYRFEDLWTFFDYTKLSSDERAWFASWLPPRPHMQEIVYNDLLHSRILGISEIVGMGLQKARVNWRLAYDSSEDRLANLLDVLRRTFPSIVRKLLILQIHERLSVAIYLPVCVDPAEETHIGSIGKVFAFPHSKQHPHDSRVIVPTKHNTCLYYDHQNFQLYEGKRANTFVFLARAANDDSKYRSIVGQGQKARIREETIEAGVNQEWRTSIMLNKFSHGLATHLGRLWREGVSSAELYVISNADTRSSRAVDLWLEQIDTNQIYSNFDHDDNSPIDIAQSTAINWDEEPEGLKAVVRDRKYEETEQLSPSDLIRCFELVWECHMEDIASNVFTRSIRCTYAQDSAIQQAERLEGLIQCLDFMPELVIHLVKLCPWKDMANAWLKPLIEHVPDLLLALVACANKWGHPTCRGMIAILSQTTVFHIEDLKQVFIKIALSVSSTETALDIISECLEPLVGPLLPLIPENSQYLLKQLAGITIDHIEEAGDSIKAQTPSQYNWRFHNQFVKKETKNFLTCNYRIDAPKSTRMSVGDHVRFRCVNPPDGLPSSYTVCFEALVFKVDPGEVTFRCIRLPPSYYRSCAWELENCGSFVTAQTMIDAVSKMMLSGNSWALFPNVMSSEESSQIFTSHPTVKSDLCELNPSQRKAVIHSVKGSLTCIWGPPGTGKTQTIVSVIGEMLSGDAGRRLLVTAPTNNAVDNVMRRFIGHVGGNMCLQDSTVLRVSTDVRKVSSDLQKYTCDAMLGKDINQSCTARKKAKQQIASARIIFTTCIGAGLGLLRTEQFQDLIIDEASQQTEAASLVPLTKGCSRAILVGDHVQLRATVRPTAAALEHDISLFERLWTHNDSDSHETVGRVMLDTQYRMHDTICAFPSSEFYESKLKTDSRCSDNQIPLSLFPWPKTGHRLVFVQVPAPEDLGRRSKSNAGQKDICLEVVKQLRSLPGDFININTSSDPKAAKASALQKTPSSFSIAILTPYTRQVEILKQAMPHETISSIDGFQGQEADIIVYVTVRCNSHAEIGFLKDMKRLNVALTRARSGMIIIGDENTLTAKNQVPASSLSSGTDADTDRPAYHDTWRRLIRACEKVAVTTSSPSK